MISPLVKASLGVGLAGATGLGGYGIYTLAFKSPKKTIRQSLQGDSGLVILDVNGTTNDNDWKAKISTLNAGTENKKLTNYEKSSNSTEELKNKEDLEKIKEVCKDLLESDSSDKSKLGEAREWCTKQAQ